VTSLRQRSVANTPGLTQKAQVTNGSIWVFAAATHCQPAGQHYRRRREQGDRHAAATRHLFNRLLGQLYYCLQHWQAFDESKAFPRLSMLPPNNNTAGPLK